MSPISQLGCDRELVELVIDRDAADSVAQPVTTRATVLIAIKEPRDGIGTAELYEVCGTYGRVRQMLVDVGSMHRCIMA